MNHHTGSRLLRRIGCSVLLAVGLLALAGCSRTYSHGWSPDRVVSTGDGAVLVWRRTTSRGGAFNGFDNDPVLMVEASFSASSVVERGTKLASSPLSIDYTWRAGDAGSPDPSYMLDDGRVVAHSCTVWQPPVSLSAGRVTCAAPDTHVNFAQLGFRGERVLAAGPYHLLFPKFDRDRDCRLDLTVFGGDLTQPYAEAADEARFGVVALPERALVYVVDRASPDLQVMGSSACGALEPIVALRGLKDMSLPADLAQFRKSMNVLDIVPGTDWRRPSVLVGYSERSQGVYREQFGVIALEPGRWHHIEVSEHGYVSGFWRGEPDRVWNLVFPYGEGFADLLISDVATSASQTQRVHPMGN